MLRRLALIFTIISLVFLPLFFAPEARAVFIDGKEIDSLDSLDTFMKSDNGLEKAQQEFCAKRQGNQMNLETWYSGKCPDDDSTFDTYTGEGVGFSDIIILDMYERFGGEKDPDKTFFDRLIEMLKNIKKLGAENPNMSPDQEQQMIASARQELFNSQDTGLLGQAGNMIGFVFQNQPASTLSYLAYVNSNLQKHHVVPQTLAASTGIGFTTFSPFLTIWIAFRNLAYLGLVVFFVVYGFMMMFRVNLGQKTVISVQLAIPKLIVTLLIITFSYAIVGLIFDLMWVLLSFFFGYLDSQGLIFYKIGNLWHPATSAAGDGGIIWSMIINSFVAIPASIFGVLSLILGGTVGGVGTVVAMLPIFGGINYALGFVIVIAVMISYAKLFFKLISALLSVVISLVTAPLVLLGNAFPGSQAIGTWLRGIVANLSVFPVTMILLLFSYLLMIQPILGIASDITGLADKIFDAIKTAVGISTPEGSMTVVEIIFGVKNLVQLKNTNITDIPLITPPWVGFSARGLLALLGIGLLLMASKYVDIVRDALKVPPFKYGSDIAGALKSGVKANNEWAKAGYPGVPGTASSGLRAQMTSHLKNPSQRIQDASDLSSKI